jgi:hypothetical protein
VQIVGDPTGFPVAVSDVEPGSTHDLTTALATGFLGALHAAASLLGLPSLADKGYAGTGVALVSQGRPSASGHRRPQPADRLPRDEGERGIALLKTR